MGDTEPEEKLGPKGLIKRSEFIRIITGALISLGFDDTGAHLEQKSGISLHSPGVKQFMKQVNNGEWDESVATLDGFQLGDEKAVKFLLLEQKFLDFVKNGKLSDALYTLRNQIMPLDGDMKRVRELASKVVTAFGDGTESENSRPKEVLEKLDSKGLIKRSEFIRVITDALISLGFDDTAAHLERKSGISLHDPVVEQFLEQVKNGEWDKSVATLEGFQLVDEKAVKFLLLEQKFLDFVKKGKFSDALDTLRNQLMPLDGDMKRVRELASKVETASGDGTESENSRPEVLEKLQKLFPAVVPKRRLEYLLEETLGRQLYMCGFHNHPDPIDSLSLFSNLCCTDPEIPRVTTQMLTEHTDEVWFLKFSHNGKYLASSSKDKTAMIWEINAEGKLVLKHKLLGHMNPVVEVLWSPDDEQVITCGDHETIKLWNVESGELVRSYEKDGVASVSCGWFHDGSGIIGGMTDKSICLWSLDGIELEHEQRKRAQKLSCGVAMTSDGKWLVSAGKECEISLFDRETRAETLIPEKDFITSFTLTKDNKHLLINLITQKICLWNIEGKPSKVFEFVGHKRRRFIIRSCFGGYKESFIASGSEDSQVYLWHWSRKERMGLRLVLPGHAGAVNCVSWNPTDIHMLASASDDRTIRIWGLDKKLK